MAGLNINHWRKCCWKPAISDVYILPCPGLGIAWVRLICLSMKIRIIIMKITNISFTDLPDCKVANGHPEIDAGSNDKPLDAEAKANAVINEVTHRKCSDIMLWKAIHGCCLVNIVSSFCIPVYRNQTFYYDLGTFVNAMGLFYWHRLTEIFAWISNHIHCTA